LRWRWASRPDVLTRLLDLTGKKNEEEALGEVLERRTAFFSG
jgi:hypothetical protein